MPTIPIEVITSKGPKTLQMLVSKKYYEEYKENHKVHEYSVQAKFFKKYLKDNGVRFKSTEEKFIGIIENKGIFTLSIYKNAVIIGIYDAKEILEKYKLSYKKFIDAYCKHLKLL